MNESDKHTKSQITNKETSSMQIKKEHEEMEYQPTAGPLPKSIYTYQLHILIRKLMKNDDFDLNKINNQYIIIFKDNSEFNLNIMQYANMEHLTLGPSDFQLYNSYYEKSKGMKAKLNDADIKKLQKIYTDLSPAEMKAINIYTSEFYRPMNALIKGNFKNFDEYFSKDKKQLGKRYIKDIIIQSAMCGNGLSKIPDKKIKKTYRAEKIFNEDMHQERIKLASEKKVIAFNNFVSSSIDKKSVEKFAEIAERDRNEAHQVRFEFTNLKGKYIAPLSVHKKEQEFLIPPTQVQLSGYKEENGVSVFQGSLVTDLANLNDEVLNIDSVKIKSLKEQLNIDLINSIKDNVNDFLNKNITKLQNRLSKNSWLNNNEKITKKINNFYNSLEQLKEIDPKDIKSIQNIIKNIEETTKLKTSIIGKNKSNNTKSFKNFKSFKSQYQTELSITKITETRELLSKQTIENKEKDNTKKFKI